MAFQSRALLGSGTTPGAVTPQCSLQTYGVALDGTADDGAALRSAALAMVAQGLLPILDGGGRTAKVIAGPADFSGINGVILRNITIDWTTVAARQATSIGVNDRKIQCGVYAQGEISTIQGHIAVDTQIGAMQAIIDTDPATMTPPVGVGSLVQIGMDVNVTKLTGNITNSSTTIPVTSTAGFDATGELIIDSEVIRYNSIDATNFYVRATPTGRGMMRSSAASHSTNAFVYERHYGRSITAYNQVGTRAEVKRVQYTYQLAAGQWVLVFDQPVDDYYTVAMGAWLRVYTQTDRVVLDGVNFIGPTGEFTPAGSDEQHPFYFFRVSNSRVFDCDLRNGTWSAGNFSDCFIGHAHRNRVSGKVFPVGMVDDYYGFSVNQCCFGIDTSDNIVTNCNKVVTYWSSIASLFRISNSRLKWGFPRHCKSNDNWVDNALMPWHDQHASCMEVHYGAGEHLTCHGNRSASGYQNYHLQGGNYVSIFAGSSSYGGRNVFAMDGGDAFMGIQAAGFLSAGQNTQAGSATLAVAINSTDTTIVLSIAPYAGVSGSEPDLDILIGTERILLGDAQSDLVTFTGCSRHRNGTTAAAHSVGDAVTIVGNDDYSAINVDLQYTGFTKMHPSIQATYLTGAVLITDVSIPVNDCAQFATPGAVPLFAVIEGVLNGNAQTPVEVVSYTGKSASSGPGNLTGVVRGKFNTAPIAHQQNEQIFQWVRPPVRNITIKDFNIDYDVDYRQILITGEQPTVGVRIAHGTLSRPNGQNGLTIQPQVHNYAIESFAHGVVVDSVRINDNPNGIRLHGNGSEARGVTGKLSIPGQTPGVGTGALVSLDGVRALAYNNDADGFDATVHFNSGCVNAEGGFNIGRNLTTSVIVDSGTATKLNVNFTIT